MMITPNWNLINLDGPQVHDKNKQEISVYKCEKGGIKNAAVGYVSNSTYSYISVVVKIIVSLFDIISEWCAILYFKTLLC